MWSSEGMPDSITLDGCEYVRADVAELAVRSEPTIERTYSVAELAELTGWSESTLYRAVGTGQLVAVMPNGTTRGMRVRASDYERWLSARTGASA